MLVSVDSLNVFAGSTSATKLYEPADRPESGTLILKVCDLPGRKLMFGRNAMSVPVGVGIVEALIADKSPPLCACILRLLS